MATRFVVPPMWPAPPVGWVPSEGGSPRRSGDPRLLAAVLQEEAPVVQSRLRRAASVLPARSRAVAGCADWLALVLGRPGLVPLVNQTMINTQNVLFFRRYCSWAR